MQFSKLVEKCLLDALGVWNGLTNEMLNVQKLKSSSVTLFQVV